ncbi:N-acetylmuramoyl-L-alanine amidase [Geobacter sp. AOG1]|uniref:N-acetylmuramoyl-L-alanine amidase n=1 Tax=Geobacter sp. AOG1 TaxID=1566346 RepID=UPI001CC4E3B2|nr:N-acetylmuramoyl-L-alanine amidase [Geobacter sp. AOG1]
MLIAHPAFGARTSPDGDTNKKQHVAKKKNKTGTAKSVKTAKVKSPKKSAVKKQVVVEKRKPVSLSTPIEPSVGGRGVVSDMRYWSNPDYTRIAVSVDREVQFEYHQLPAIREASVPPRLYIDLKGTHVAPGVKDIPIGDGLLKMARIGQYRADTVRVVLDMESIKDFKIFTFSDPFRIIIDVKGDRREELTKPRETILTPLVPLAPTVKPESVEQKKPPKPVIGKVRRIVVDPGHGGHDPGASGANGGKEKDVVLQIGLKLAKLLRDELGLDVVMTRSTDVFLELQERTAIANKVGADLFVSIHANAALNRNVSGIETYYLNLAKTEKAAQLAAKENGTSLEKVSLLQAVLFDLMANYKLNDSAHLADEVQKALYHKVSGGYAGVKNLGVKQGPFYVLVGATMPSILVETAFLSNEKEEVRLRDAQYQDATAAGIMGGIRAYMSSMK